MSETPSWFRWCGPSLFAIAFLIRLLGIGWGLPSAERHWSLHPDEPVVLAAANRLEPWAAKLDPGFYNYGTFPLALFRVAGAIWPGGGDGWQGRASDLLAGRIVSALAGAGCALVVFLILRGRTAWLGSVLGGLAVAFAPGLVVHSDFMTVDVLASFWIVLAVWLSLEAGWPSVEREEASRFRWLLCAGLAVGLAASTKYSGLVAVSAPILAGVGLAPERRITYIGSAFLAAIVAFVATTPGLVLQPQAFKRDFLFEMQHVATGHGLVFAGTSPAWLFQLGNLVIAFGPFLVLLGAIGWAVAARTKAAWVWPVLVVALLSYVLIGRAEVKFLRYALPLVPLLGIGLGYLVGEAHKRGTLLGKLAVAMAILGIGGMPSGGAAASLIALKAMSETDPRDAAGAYLRSKPETTRVYLPNDPWFYSPTLSPNLSAPRWVPEEVRHTEALELMRPKVSLARHPWDLGPLDESPDYVVFSSFENEGEARLLEQGVKDERNVAYVAFLDRLEQGYMRDRVFPAGGFVPAGLTAVHDMMYVRPILWVWRRKTDSMAPSSSSSTP